MANKREWNFTEGENTYNVVFEKNKLISVNGSEPVKISKLKSKESNILEAVYDVDLGDGKVAKLCMRKSLLLYMTERTLRTVSLTRSQTYRSGHLYLKYYIS